ncbi:MAG: hypothetical protein IJZ53_10465 [Tyzzerella sp.]|nr:hypothetical protein [Tyzzerella sp.]
MSSYLKRIVALCMAGVMLFTVGCGGSKATTSDYEVTEALLGDVDVEQLSSNRFTQLEPAGDKALPQYKLDGFTLVTENEKLALYVKEDTASIRVLNKESGFVWGALEVEDPENLNDTWGSFAQSVVSISYMDSTGATKQIGAGHEDAERKFTYGDNGFTVSVSFKDDIDISLDAKVALNDDHLTFSVDDSTIKEEGEFYISAVYFIPFLGSTIGNQTDGYMLVPDGSGALLRYQNPAKYLKAYSGRVYGMDYAIDNLGELNDLASNRPVEFLKSENTVTMPVYGLTLGVNNQALFGHVTAGEAYAYIDATPAGISTDYNWAASHFVYRQVYSQPTSKNGAGVPVVQKDANTVNPSVDIYFLSGEEANYSGMAKLYSNILKEEGSLQDNMSDTAPQIVLDFVAADIEEGLLSNSTKEVTSIAYMEKAIKTLQEAGLERIGLTVKGWQDGGLSGYQKSELFTDTVIGSFDDFSSVKDTLTEAKGSLLLYSDPLRATEVQINSRQDAGITLSQSTITKTAVEETEFLGDVWYLKTALGMSYFADQMDVLAENGLDAAIDGANLLYGEYLVDEFVSREETKAQLSKTYADLAEEGGLTLFNPNDYLLKYTSVYRNTPVSGSQDLYETDSVPFLQMVLSGNMTMVAPYANESFYSKIDLLKCIEYNVYPSYILTETDNLDLTQTTIDDLSSTRFNDWQETIKESYFFVSEVLQNVEGQQMTKHQRINSTIFAITYETGTVYVNYGDADYTLGNGTVIPAENGMFVPSV